MSPPPVIALDPFVLHECWRSELKAQEVEALQRKRTNSQAWLEPIITDALDFQIRGLRSAAAWLLGDV